MNAQHPVRPEYPRRTRVVWLTWHSGTRSRSLAHLVQAHLHEYTSRPTGILRHIQGTFWTLRILYRLLPDVIFLQNSFMLLLAAATYKLGRRGVTLVADCHNKSLDRRLGGPIGGLFFALKKWSFAQTDLVIVSNQAMLASARLLAIRAAVVRDPLPLDIASRAASHGSCHCVPDGPYVLFPCGFGPDEPIETIFEVANTLSDQGIATLITGNDHDARHTSQVTCARLVTRTGYLPTACYFALLYNASAVVALTNDDRCLMCAAYEALAAGRPLVVSDTGALRECFGRGAEYCLHDANLIATVVSGLIEPGRVAPEGAKAEFVGAFQKEFAELLSQLRAVGAIPLEFPTESSTAP